MSSLSPSRVFAISIHMECTRSLSDSRNGHNVPRKWRVCCLGLFGFGTLLGLSAQLLNWLSGVIDNALYLVLFLDYLKSAIPSLESGFLRLISLLALTAALTYMNYRGSTVMGWMAILLGVFSVLPFVVMGFVAIPKIEPSQWLIADLNNVNWSWYLNTLFWNLNYWDSVSTLTGEVENPSRTLPRALFYALVLVIFGGYVFPLLIGMGTVPVRLEDWTDGYFLDIAKLIGGIWLRTWVQAASALSNMGIFVAQLNSDSFQLLGTAERRYSPVSLLRGPFTAPPYWDYVLRIGVLLLSWLSFQEIVAAKNFLYCSAMIMEFLAFVKLRQKYPEAPRPYMVPVGTNGAILTCTPLTLLIFVVLVLAPWKIIWVALVAVATGLVMLPCLSYSERKRWFRFSRSPDLPDLYFCLC